MDKIYNLHLQANSLYIEFWKNNVFLSFNWWLLIILLILPWFIWWKLVDKKHVKLILTFGFLVTVIVIILDDMGSNLAFWEYPYKIMPILPRLNAVDLSIIPVLYMLVYQYAKKFKTYLLAHIILSAFSSFIAEPIFVALNIYNMPNWKYVYSFPIYIVIAVFAKWTIDSFNRRLKVYEH